MAFDGSFRFDMEVEAFEKADGGKRRRRIGGFVTTERIDRQGERLIQKGLNFSPFVKHGWFNYNHGKGIEDVVGHPEDAVFIQKGEKLPSGAISKQTGWYVEGYLLEGAKKADEVWDMAIALQKSDRRLGFSVEGKVAKREERHGIPTVVEATITNVAVTHCFPGDVRVAGLGRSVTRRFYEGPMIEIHLSSGEKLTGTPNHPVFTQRGWVALRDVDERFDRIGCTGGDLVSSTTPSVAHHVENVPPTFQEVFDLATLSGANHRVGSAGEGEFHGDADVRHREVDVVATDGLLRERLAASFAQHFGEDVLAAADKETALLANAGQPFARFKRDFGAASSFVGGGGEGESFLGCALGIAAELLFAPSASHTAALRDVVNGLPSDSVFGGDAGRALSPLVGFSDVAFKRVFQFAGHVFNLDTDLGWYGANGIVAHNCPVNTDTSLEVLAKSMTAFEKALTASAGQAIPGAATPGDGFAIQTESLEGSRGRRKKKKARRGLTKAEGVRFLLQRRPSLGIALASRIYDFAARSTAG